MDEEEIISAYQLIGTKSLKSLRIARKINSEKLGALYLFVFEFYDRYGRSIWFSENEAALTYKLLLPFINKFE